MKKEVSNLPKDLADNSKLKLEVTKVKVSRARLRCSIFY